MASRDIANMHLFLEMKKKFPHLPEDILRNYVFLYAEDQDKCVSLLHQESENHFHPSQPFSDILRLPDSKSILVPKKNENFKLPVNRRNDSPNLNTSHGQNSSSLLNTSTACNSVPVSGRSTSHAGVLHLPCRSLNLSVPLKPEVQSAPVIRSHEQPFSDMYKYKPVSSHTTLCQVPDDYDYNNRMMFSTTKEHTVVPPADSRTDESSPASVTPETDHSKRQAVKLSIIPSFPFQQQQVNVYNSSVCATASHSSRPGRHTTSLNFQLQPQSSDQSPLEISTIPTNIGNVCDYRDFGSHVQISVGSQGATFTALRLQRPHSNQTQQTKYSSSQLPQSEQFSRNFSQASSQAQNSNVFKFPSNMQQTSNPVTDTFMGTTEGTDKFESAIFPQESQNQTFSKDEDLKTRVKYPIRKSNAQTSLAYGYQASPDYMQAVKKHQLAQLELVLEELEKENVICSQLKAEVNKMEQEVSLRSLSQSSFSYAEELKKLREENRKLRIECNCLLMEVDMCDKEQIPVGMTDEDFYSNIFTGPNGAIESPSKTGKKNSKPETMQSEREPIPFEEDEDDEKNRWRCKNCTFANHPALEKCEMCELPKNSGSFFDDS